jgi:endoglucanase
MREFVDFRQKFTMPVRVGESGENTDAWIDSFRRLLEQNRFGWCFWPYKITEGTSYLVTFDMPRFCDEITRYADSDRSTFEAIRKNRPPVDQTRAALSEFLQNCRFENCRANPGYIDAPWAGHGMK